MRPIPGLLALGLSTLTCSNVIAQWGMPSWGSFQTPTTSYQQPGNWGGMGMMPWGGQQQTYAPRQRQQSMWMPWGSQQQTYAPRQRQQSMWMPWGGQQQAYAPQRQQSMWMPWGGDQQQSYASQQNSTWMPGMDQGIRTMMSPGKIMAEEATPSMLMTPTWKR